MRTRMTSIIAGYALAAASVILASTAGAQQLVGKTAIAELPPPAAFDTTGLFLARYVKVGEDVFIGGQPTERALRELKAQGVTTVVNLRMQNEMDRVGFDEKKLVEELGMTYVHLPSRGGEGEFAYSPATLRRFTETMQSAQGKVLLLCTIAWRASHLWGAYLIERGVPTDQALTHARAINLMDDHRMDGGVHPMELFLGRKVPGLGQSR